jgi:integrase
MSPEQRSQDAQDGASESCDNITLPLDNVSNGREEGNNSRPGHEYESQDPKTTGDNPLGTGEQSLPFIDIDGDVVKLAEIDKRFKHETILSLKPDSQNSYMETFTRLWNHAQLGNYTKQQLAGKKGKELIKGFIQTIPKPSQGNTLAKLKRVWTAALDLSWPITKDDIGRLPRVRREVTPDDSIVKPWAVAMANESDPYLRLLWLLDGDFGLRPSHICNLRWGDVKYEDGHPFKIEAEPEGQFKTDSPVVAWLPPDVVKALEEWKAIHPNPNPGALILPYRDMTGKVEVSRKSKRKDQKAGYKNRQVGQMDTALFEKRWDQLRTKYNLPKLRPKDMRHWIATKAAKVEMSENARAFMQGHDPRSYNGSMGTVYNNESREKALDEQARLFPNGALALLMPVQVEILDDIPPEALSLLKQFMGGEMDSYEFMPQLMTLRKQAEKTKLARGAVQANV